MCGRLNYFSTMKSRSMDYLEYKPKTGMPRKMMDQRMVQMRDAWLSERISGQKKTMSNRLNDLQKLAEKAKRRGDKFSDKTGGRLGLVIDSRISSTGLFIDRIKEKFDLVS